MLLVWALALGLQGAAGQTTAGWEVHSTWPNGIYPGLDCLPYDGSKVPDCKEYVNPDHYVPFYHEHSQNCSRFWECGPTYETCLFECAACPCLDRPPENCDPQCKGESGYQWALTFDDKFHFWPEGPTCVFPIYYEGNCTNVPNTCDCLDWQTCINDVCSPQCIEDSHCPDGYICDDCGWCQEIIGCNGDHTLCDGYDNLCNIPEHDNCFYCDGTEPGDCQPGCASDKNCVETHPICGHGGGEHLCGCTTDEDCKTGFICDTGDLDGDGDDKECIPDGCYENNGNCEGFDAVCNIPAHDNCFWCDGMECKPGCIDDNNCPEFNPICGYNGNEHLCGCEKTEDCPTDYICNDEHTCVEDIGCDATDEKCPGFDELCNIPAHDNCFWCNDRLCEPGCASDDNCPENRPLCGANGDHRCGCSVDADCPTNLPLCEESGNGKECVDGCRDDDICGCSSADVKCDLPDYKNCHYCDIDNLQCADGCCTDENCPDTHPICGHGGGEHLCGCNADADCLTDDGYICDLDNHECKYVGCNHDDKLCVGFNETCINPPTHHENCYYCTGEDCEIGCASDENCPNQYPICGHGGADHLCGCNENADCSAGYECNTDIHECKFPQGKVLVDSIKIYTASCDGCAEEGVVIRLLGEKNGNFPDGVPCQTNTLDHQSTIDFASGSTVFDGRTAGGQDDQTERNMMGSCYEGALNSQLADGGEVSWAGAGTWTPQAAGGVCVDWRDPDAWVWTCDLQPSGSSWTLGNCASVSQKECP